jgi:hypothetical protein
MTYNARDVSGKTPLFFIGPARNAELEGCN